MTITQGAPPPTRNTPVALARGVLTGGVTGASLAAFAVGCVIESVPLCVTGVGLPAVYGLLFFLAGVPRRAREAAIPPRTALAQIESLEAVGGEATSDVAVRFDVTVAPDDDVPAYRVEFTQHINLADLPDYRPGGVVVVQYPPDRLWKVRIVKRPTPEWEERVGGARLDSAPGPATVREPSGGCAVGFVTAATSRSTTRRRTPPSSPWTSRPNTVPAHPRSPSASWPLSSRRRRSPWGRSPSRCEARQAARTPMIGTGDTVYLQMACAVCEFAGIRTLGRLPPGCPPGTMSSRARRKGSKHSRNSVY